MTHDELKKLKMKRLCYAAPKKMMAAYLDDIEQAGYTNIVGSIKSGMVKVYFDHSFDNVLIFDAIEIQRGFWACRGREGVIDAEEEENEI